MHLHPSALPDSWRWGMRKGGCTFSRRGATSWLSMTQVCMYAHVCVRLCVCVCVLAWARVCMQSLVCQWHRRMHARHVRRRLIQAPVARTCVCVCNCGESFPVSISILAGHNS